MLPFQASTFNGITFDGVVVETGVSPKAVTLCNGSQVVSSFYSIDIHQYVLNVSMLHVEYARLHKY